ncbi:MAG: HAD family hydrolase [Prolixibacteraceae bacterium]
MIKAIILDRDGVITNNSKHYYIWEKEQLQFVDGIYNNLKQLTQSGFKLFIVSNQGGISKGLYSREDILNIHDKMNSIFETRQVEITDILFCPHHPENEKCLCRKPESLMLERIISRYDLNKTESYFIGDSDSDMKAAKKAGIQGIKIPANQDMYPFISHLTR